VRKLIAFVAITSLLVVWHPDAARASGGTGSCSLDPSGQWTCLSGASNPGSPGGGVPVSQPSGGGGGASGCPQGYTYVTWTDQNGNPAVVPPRQGISIGGHTAPPGTTPIDVYCGSTYITTIFTKGGTPTAPIYTGGQLANQAVASFTLAKPVPVHSPPEAVVHFPTWLWLTGGYRTQSATAADPTGLLSATVMATPTKVVWTMGDGQLATCFGPGVAYRLNVPPDAQTSNCTATYIDTSATQANQAYQATVTVFYHATWTATDGTGGDLGTLSAATTFAVRVAEVQSINNA
jgi:hypothetical protein